MRTVLYLMTLLILFLAAFSPPEAGAQTYNILDDSVKTVAQSYGTGTLGRDSLVTPSGTDIVECAKLDSLHLFLETNGAVNLRLLVSPVKLHLEYLESTTIADTLLVKNVTRTASGTSGVTWQELRQAFSGAVPPRIQFYLFADSNATGKGVAIGANVKEYYRP